jgi:hypothetical protein
VLGSIAAQPDADGIIFDRASGRVVVVSGDKGVLMSIKPDIDLKNGKIDSPVDLGGAPEFLANHARKPVPESAHPSIRTAGPFFAGYSDSASTRATSAMRSATNDWASATLSFFTEDNEAGARHDLHCGEVPRKR